ncbi:hypothetical protein HPB51_011281 [Rhipicephalus microplus]|uniref:Uncharacterized protein n=1 Tax=Rhipicephalus microplus TaxID=6941 RepID=A0A9J6DM49_RHIMP|nr:hypothetical protein HPB51_011281 [Rhipicephalus microplus]
MVVASWWQVKADTISKCFKRAGFLRNAEALEDEQGDTSLADETLNTDDVWSCLVYSNFVTTTDNFQEFVDAGESELPVCEEASTDDAIVAAVRGNAEVATDDESDGEDDVDLTPEPDFPCKGALEYLAKGRKKGRPSKGHHDSTKESSSPSKKDCRVILINGGRWLLICFPMPNHEIVQEWRAQGEEQGTSAQGSGRLQVGHGWHRNPVTVPAAHSLIVHIPFPYSRRQRS